MVVKGREKISAQVSGYYSSK